MRFNKLDAPSSVKFNGININDLSYKSFYRNVNILNQMPYIFQDSLLNNITMGDKYTDDEIFEVIRTAQLTSFVKEYGFDYELKEDANNISGGQKQRIGLARLLLRKPQLLILDEPTAALDEKTSINLVKDLREFASKNGMTIFVISHSNVFDNTATQILTLE
jgi:ABC transporter ATM